MRSGSNSSSSMATLESDSTPDGADCERGRSGSRESSSSWSDVEGDEYLAKTLAADNYLRGGSAKAGMPLSEDGLARGVLKDSIGNLEARGQQSKSDTIVVHHPACELHEMPDHPERPGRVRAIMNALMRNFPDTRVMLAPEAEIEQVLRFHCRPHVDEILRLCSEAEKRYRAAEARADAAETAAEKGGGRRSTRSNTGVKRARDELRRAGIVRIDSDTAVMPASREAILRAAGAACFAVDEVMSGRARNAFCCVRPPGHHAEPDAAMGFCFFNNAPIGALHAQAEYGIERVAVVDIDVHHGNGTQAAFAKDPTTFYASTHQGPFFYPGTGFDDEKGVASNIVNANMEYGEGSRDFRRAYSEKILPALEAFRPGLIVISAGFDAHRDDPLAGIVLDEDDYGWVTKEICTVASRVCGGRVVSILEGGYNLQAISDSAVEHVRALREAASAVNASSSDPLSADGLKVADNVRCRIKGRLRSGARVGKTEREHFDDVGTASPSSASMEESPPSVTAAHTADFNLTETFSGPPPLVDAGGGLPKAETKMRDEVIRVKQRAPGCLGDDSSGGRSDDVVGVDWDVNRELDPEEVEEIDELIAQLSLADDKCS